MQGSREIPCDELARATAALVASLVRDYGVAGAARFLRRLLASLDLPGTPGEIVAALRNIETREGWATSRYSSIRCDRRAAPSIDWTNPITHASSGVMS
jgi:hypothetical protein